MTIVPFPEVTEHNACGLLREAANQGRVSWTNHVKERMNQRSISTRQIIDCLRLGQLSGSPELDEHGNYKCRIDRRVAGVTLTVVAVLQKRPNGLWGLVVTTF